LSSIPRSLFAVTFRLFWARRGDEIEAPGTLVFLPLFSTSESDSLHWGFLHGQFPSIVLGNRGIPPFREHVVLWLILMPSSRSIATGGRQLITFNWYWRWIVFTHVHSINIDCISRVVRTYLIVFLWYSNQGYQGWMHLNFYHSTHRPVLESRRIIWSAHGILDWCWIVYIHVLSINIDCIASVARSCKIIFLWYLN